MDLNTGLSFGAFHLRGVNGPLLRDGQALKLQRKALKVLWTLACQAHQVVTKDALLDAVWPRVVVGEDALSFQIQSLRQVLEDDARRPRFIATVHGIGYRFIVDVDTQRPERPRTSIAQLAGRKHELAWLDTQLARALRGERRLLFVTGDPGVGKTTLVRSFVSQPGVADAFVGIGQCIEQVGGGEAYLPLFEALGRMCRNDDKGLVIDVLRRVAPTWLVHMPGLLTANERDEMQPRLAGATRQRMLRELAEALDAIALVQPVVLVLEDLHWSDVPTTELLSMLARRLEPAAVMVICTFREVEAVLASHPINPLKLELKARSLAHELALGPLDATAVHTILRARLPTISEPLAAAVYRRSEGHALYVEQLAEFIAQFGLTDPETLAQALPSVLVDLIEIQLLKLPPEMLEVLEVASIVPGEFAVASLAAALQQPEAVVEHWCERLARQGRVLDERGLAIWPDGTASGRYAFHHCLIQEVLKKRLSGARAVRAQRRMGERKERAWGERAHEIASELAAHFEVSAQPDKEARYRTLAAKNSRRAAAFEEARAHAQRGLELLASCSPELLREPIELELSFVIAAVTNAQVGYGSDEARGLVERIAELAADFDPVRPADLRLLHHAHLTVCMSHLFGARMADAIALAARSISLFRAHGAADLQCQMMAIAAFAHYLRGELREAEALLAEAEPLAELADATVLIETYTDPCTTFHQCAASVAWLTGHAERSQRHLERSLERARSIGNPHILGSSLAQASVHYLQRGHLAESELAALECIAECNRAGEAGWASIGMRMLQIVRGDSGDINLLKQMIDGQRAVGARANLPYDYTLLAAATRGAEARAAIDAGFAEIERSGNRLWLAELWRLDGVWHADHGDMAAAELALQRALCIAREQGALALELRAVLSLAPLWRDRVADVRRLVSEVLGRFEEGFDMPDFAAARALLQTEA